MDIFTNKEQKDCSLSCSPLSKNQLINCQNDQPAISPLLSLQRRSSSQQKQRMCPPFMKIQAVEKMSLSRMTRYRNLQSSKIHQNSISRLVHIRKSNNSLFESMIKNIKCKGGSLDHFFTYYESSSSEIHDPHGKGNSEKSRRLAKQPPKTPITKKGSAQSNFGSHTTKQQQQPCQTPIKNPNAVTEEQKKLSDLNKNAKSSVNCNKNQEISTKTGHKQTELSKKADIVQIGDKSYRRKYNMEFKMQLRRKSCCCSNCGANTQFENKHQSIVNAVLIRKKRHLTKIIKVVNFLNAMNKTFKGLPSSDDKLSFNKVLYNNNNAPSMTINSLQQIESDDANAAIEQTRVILKNIDVSSQLPRKSMTENLKIKNRPRKSMTISLNDQNQIENISKESDNDEEQQQREDVQTKKKFNRKKLKKSTVSTITHQNENEQEDQDYSNRASSFIQFVQNKIQEAKKKKQLEQIKFVGKTRIDVLLKLLSVGKKSNIFENCIQGKKMMKLLSSKQSSSQGIHPIFENSQDKLTPLSKNIQIYGKVDKLLVDNSRENIIENIVPPLSNFLKDDTLSFDFIKEREQGFDLSLVNRVSTSPSLISRKKQSNLHEKTMHQSATQGFLTQKAKQQSSQDQAQVNPFEIFKVRSHSRKELGFIQKNICSSREITQKEQQNSLIVRNMKMRQAISNVSQNYESSIAQNVLTPHKTNSSHQQYFEKRQISESDKRSHLGLSSRASSRQNFKQENSSIEGRFQICKNAQQQLNQIQYLNKPSINITKPQTQNQRIKLSFDRSSSNLRLSPYLNKVFSIRERPKSPERSTLQSMLVKSPQSIKSQLKIDLFQSSSSSSNYKLDII